jgi:hypothetical protein
MALAHACPGECTDPTASYPWLDVGGLWLFWSRGADGSTFLWQTDLTSEGTLLITTLPGELNVEPSDSVRAGNSVVFGAHEPVHGQEPWVVPFELFEPPPPPGPWVTAETLPGFAVKVRISIGDGKPLPVRQEAACIPETLCISGAIPGRSEVFVRVSGPKPNGRLWPTIVKFTTSAVEVWIQQASTGKIRYYRLDGAAPGVDELPGLFDREGFEP